MCRRGAGGAHRESEAEREHESDGVSSSAAHFDAYYSINTMILHMTLFVKVAWLRTKSKSVGCWGNEQEVRNAAQEAAETAEWRFRVGVLQRHLINNYCPIPLRRASLGRCGPFSMPWSCLRSSPW